ncbi:MAG TPA: hypothetical protein VNA14_04570 [Mycobacteriales bacterium]|nr:hypothetical protein [Mycobacteriales bacterium]
MRWTRGSTTSPVPESAVLLTAPDLSLLDEAGQHDVLARLVGLLDAGRAVQVRHERRHLAVDMSGRSAEAVLTRALAAEATVWPTQIVGGDTGDGSVDDPDVREVVAVRREYRTCVELVDGTWARTFVVSRWPAQVPLGWTGALRDVADVIVLHLRPVPVAVAAAHFRRRVATLISTAAVDEQAGRVADPETAQAIDAAESLWESVQSGATTAWWAQLLLTVVAPDRAALDDRGTALRNALAPWRADVRLVAFRQRRAYDATVPGGAPLPGAWRMLDATSAAASIPAPLGPTTPTSGVLAGADEASGAPLLVDRFALHNPARLVVGTSGAGKSYATKLEVCRWRVRGAEAVVVDPEGEFTRLGDVLQGLVLAVGEEPAGLDPVGLATRPGLAAAEGLAVLASVAAALLGGPLSAVDLALLDRALMVLRADRGHRATMADLLGVLAEVAAHPPFTGSDLAARLSPAASGSLAQLFAANPDLDDPPPLVVFDLRSVPARARPAVMACVLAWTWDRATTGAVATPRLLVVDEAHLLLDDPAAADLLAQFARRARKYHLGVDVVTQRLADFLGNPAGQAVLANTATKLLLGCEDHDRAAVAAGLGLTHAEADLLRAGRRGHGLLLTPSLRAAVRIVAHPAEHELASAGPRPR